MESNKFALLFVAMAVVFLVAAAPTVAAARNKVMAFDFIATANIRNPFANIFAVDTDKPAENCNISGSFCYSVSTCCSGKCTSPSIFPPTPAHCV
ncbi:hypothetical protein V6N13_092355 [Hibiscus sabdariffa]